MKQFANTIIAMIADIAKQASLLNGQTEYTAEDISITAKNLAQERLADNKIKQLITKEEASELVFDDVSLKYKE